ncbi:MAG: N-acetylmuramoyl-L-alanine amidase [Bacteroidales bacterium]|nr:N-acetylmuramoyl-L-alanine amidase [Bacteroidales bacterium]
MNIKNGFLLLCCLTFFNAVIFAQSTEKKFKLVIDAGHGGEDPGCRGKKSQEKTVTLNVALKLGKLISDNYDDVQVIYTRKTDVFVEVYKRAVIANNNHADLFISIHCNAAENKSAHGVETWVMGLAKSDANMEVAKKENAAILKEKNFENNYEGFNPNSPEANVIFSLHTSAYMNHSIMLADKVQKNLVRNTHLLDRTVKQAGFWVLYKVAMPSILIELGFLSNAVEEEYMIKPGSQDVMAVSIYNSFVEYRNALDGTNKPLLPLPKASEQEKSAASADAGVAPEPYKPAPKADADVAADPVKPQSKTDTEVAADPVKPAPKQDTDVAADPVKPQPKADAGVAAEPIKPAPKQDADVAADPVKPQPKSDAAVAAEPVKPAPQAEVKPASQVPAQTAVQHNIRFRVQIAAIPENVSVTDSRFNKVKDVRKFKEGKFWKYTSGNATTLDEAQEILKAVKPYFADAFIIAFDGENKIPVSQAVERLK